MEKTTHYQLNKPEAADPLRLADFNENADKIDAALAAVRNEAANNLAAYQTSNDAAVAALQDASTRFGNCRVVTGTYRGTDKYTANNPSSLTFDQEPIALFISGYDHTAVLLRGSSGFVVNDSTGIRFLECTWGTTVQWYSTGNSVWQMNHNTTYAYFALFA